MDCDHIHKFHLDYHILFNLHKSAFLKTKTLNSAFYIIRVVIASFGIRKLNKFHTDCDYIGRIKIEFYYECHILINLQKYVFQKRNALNFTLNVTCRAMETQLSLPWSRTMKTSIQFAVINQRVLTRVYFAGQFVSNC